MSLPLRITIRLVLTIALVWALSAYGSDYVTIVGGLPAWIVIGSLLTIMNLIVRPALQIVTAPIHFVASIFAHIIVNAVFALMTVWIAAHLEPDLVIVEIKGIAGWIVIPAILGIGNWIIKLLTHRDREPS